MKKLLPLAVIVFLISCTKSDLPAPDAQETVVTMSAMSEFKPGKNVRFFNVNLTVTPVNSIVAGQNQQWDYSAVSPLDSSRIDYLAPVANDTFATATHMQLVTDSFGTSASLSQYYGELSESGMASLGKKIQQLYITSPTGASLVLPAQSIRFTQKYYTANFPMRFNDSVSARGIKEVYKMVVNVPGFYNNANGTETTTIEYDNKVVASGKMKLKGFTENMPVLVVRQHYKSTTNYIINNQTPPQQLLAAAGATEGEIRESTTYSFYNPVLGFVGSVFVDNNVVLGATFRKNF